MVHERYFIQWLVENFYNEKTRAHVERVAKHIEENSLIPEDMKPFCVNLAYLHDIIEDNPSKIDWTIFDNKYAYALAKISKSPNETYDQYCDRINFSHFQMKHPDDQEKLNIMKCVWWVKLADMWDHLDQAETLTERLKEKYLSGLRYLL